MNPEKDKINKYKKALECSQSGSERVWAYRNHTLVSQGFYSSDDLIEMSLKGGFQLFDPFIKIREGTVIENGVCIGQNCSVIGLGVRIGKGTFFNQGQILGNNVHIGSQNVIRGDIEIDGLKTGPDNILGGIFGVNNGSICVGDNNTFQNVRFSNPYQNKITIGNQNKFYQGLSINIPFNYGSIVIGHFNSLGRDGGGVISASYRFGNRWGGDLFIGRDVEMTRGAEVLGFSVLGWPLPQLIEKLQLSESQLAELIKTKPLHELADRFKYLNDIGYLYSNETKDPNNGVSLFGVTKIKRSILVGKATIKDDTRTFCSYLRGVVVPERCKIFNSEIVPSGESLITNTIQDSSVLHQSVNENSDWTEFDATITSDSYPAEDSDYFDQL